MKPEPLKPIPEPQGDDARAWLSALADGESAAAEPACKLWRDDAGMRQTWHAYQLIGDVMRSDELARPASGDVAFLAGLRERLAAEPVLLAQAPAPARPQRRQAWLVPVAAAAGFVAVAGVLVVARVSEPGAAAPATMAAASAGGEVLRVGQEAPRPMVTVTAEGDALLRDANLDQYLRAHQFARGGAAVAMPGGGLRRAEMTVPVANPAR